MSLIIYGTMVKVIAGFYLGCTGVIIDNDIYVDDFIVDLTCEYTTVKGIKVVASEKVKMNRTKLEVLSTPRK